MLAGCGHGAQQERLDQVNELLLEFLAELGDKPFLEHAVRPSM